jgi:RHH-type rel operon transcriptional repressor/antitoxin RelB
LLEVVEAISRMPPNQLVAQTGRAKSYYLRELIEGGMDDLEDFYLADATMERVRKGQETLLDAAQVRKELDLDLDLDLDH